jgi:ACR3 family arsenite efflux pump ArsB
MLFEAACCFFMTGLIWMVQLVHYPSFAYVDQKKFGAFHVFHSKAITWMVLPVMAVELALAVLLVAKSPDLFWKVNLAGLVLIWLATASLSVPIHNQLAIAPTDALAARLVWTNWPRTILWSLRSLGILYVLA